MADSDQKFRGEFLEATLSRLEGELARVAAEIAEVRALMDLEQSRPVASRADAPAQVAPAAPPPPAPTPAAEPASAWPRVEPEPPPRPPMHPPAPPLRPPAPPMQPPAPPPPAPPPPPPGPPPPPRRTLGELAHDWDLVGARGFAIAGGAVMAFGIGLFFVLASNRGWIDDRARVALGAVASALAVGGGFFLRARFGQYWAALAAVGAGIAGAYATLAAAAARYDLVPDALALPLAGAIAAGATVVAVRWRSQTIAALGLIGAALAPALQALDVVLTWESTAFAVIVLLAAGAVAIPLRWRELLISISVIVGLQVEWLVASVGEPVGAGTLAVAAAFALGLLAFAVGLQVATRKLLVDPTALAYSLAAFAVVLLGAVQLFDPGTDRGIALLVAAAIWVAVFGALQWRKLEDLALAVGVSALALAAVGTADVLVGGTLTLVWAAEAVVLAIVAHQLGDARLRAMAIAYAALASMHALVTDARLDFLFSESADHVEGVLPLAAAAVAALACGLLAPGRYEPRTEEGLLAFVREVRLLLDRYRAGAMEALCFAAAALATLACSFALVAMSFESGHVAASALAAAVGAAALASAGLRRSAELATASYAWLLVVLFEAFAFDAPEFYDDLLETSTGGWSALAAAAALLAGAYAYRVLDPKQQHADVVLGVAAAVAAGSTWASIALLTQTERILGLGYLAAAAAFGALAAGVFAREGFRNASTILWALGLPFLIGAEAILVTDPVARTVVIAATALALGVLARLVDEVRLWLAGGAVVLLTSAVSLLVLVQPWLDEGQLELRLAIASGACAFAAFGLAALVWRDGDLRDFSTILWSAGIVAVLATERVLMDDLRWTAFVVALTGAVLAALARPLGESRLWLAGGVVAGMTTAVVVIGLTPPSHLFEASASPGAALWVLAACIVALIALALTAPNEDVLVRIGAVAGGLALYAVSLGILELAERLSSASVETDFERGHVAVSAVWALTGLGLLVAGLLRGSSAVRYAGLALFGVSLAKIFLYDLAELSSVTRAFSFIFVGALLLAGGFFLQRLGDRLGPHARSTTTTGDGAGT
jgi:uncharacterized membrane protein